MTYCNLLSTSWWEEKVKWHISQGLQALGGRRKASLFSILSRISQVIRGKNFLPGRLHKTFPCPSISSARTITCCASANVAQSWLRCAKPFMMLKSREMRLVMLCWRPGDQGLYWARTILYFFCSWCCFSWKWTLTPWTLRWNMGIKHVRTEQLFFHPASEDNWSITTSEKSQKYLW